MVTPSERTVSVKQTSKAAVDLPLELMQHVFLYLDSKSFFAAGKVCKYWQSASTDTVPLARQLRKLPILPPVDVTKSSPGELHSLFEEAAQKLFMSIKSLRKSEEPGAITRALRKGLSDTSKTASTRDGAWTVVLDGRTIGLFNTSGENSTCVARRTLNDLKETVGNGPWLKAHDHMNYEMALSSSGTLLAVAQERTIQIYDLTAEADSFTVNEYVSSATGHYICGLDFEHDDHVLRVRLSGRGTVLYVGTPLDSSARPGQLASIDYWKSKKGLKHTFLDSSLITISPASYEVDQVARLSGLQLLQPFDGGWLFAAQRHGGGESSHYVLGHVTASVPHNMAAPKVVCGSAIVLARLESFLSSFEYTLESSNEDGLGLWENMPSAHEQHSRFAMTLEGRFIAIAERDKRTTRPTPLTQLFVYKAPGAEQLRSTLKRIRSDITTKMNDKHSTPHTLLDRLEVQDQQSLEAKSPRLDKATKYTVPRLPLCLSTIQGDIEYVSFTRSNAAINSYRLSAATAETTRSWCLEEW